MICFECLSKELWRERYQSFGEFCEKELGVKVSRSSQLAAAYEVWGYINSTTVEFSERQIRPLTAIKQSRGRNWVPSALAHFVRWRERYQSFGEFCEKELGIKQNTGSRYASAYEVWPHLNIPNGIFGEGQLRPLTAIKQSRGRN